MSTPPDDRTLLVSAGRHAGAAAPPVQPDHALPPATEVGGFEIESVLGAGGFGIVYLAYDRMLQRHVALKEYMPAAFALRSGDGRVHPRSERDAEAFGIGLRSFVNEARLLAQFDAPSLLRVYRFWEAQGTAYMVMPYYRGPTLKQALAQADAPMDEAALRRLLDDILDALELLHAQRCYHRDIAPDNILMADGRQPVLLDFGAARSAIGDMTQAFTAIFKQAYAPVEQIGGDGDLRQGPWTDLFALAGVLHFAIDGRPPPPSIGRLLSDTYVPLAQRYAGRYDHAFLAALDAALAVRPQDRPQSVAQMRRLLDAGEAVNVSATGAAPVQATPPSPPPEAPRPAAAPQDASQHALQEALQDLPQNLPPPGAPARRRAASLPAARLIAALAAIALAIGIGGYFVAGRAAPEAAKHAAQATPPSSAQRAMPALPAPLAQLLAGADAAHAVAATVGQPRVVVGHDRFGFSIRSAREGYLYVYMLGSGQNGVLMLFPNLVDIDNRIGAGQTLRLPRPAWEMEVGGPAGIDRFVAIVADRPRTFAQAAPVEGQIYSVFPAGSSGTVLAGAPVCADGLPCSAAYGAASFAIEEVAR